MQPVALQPVLPQHAAAAVLPRVSFVEPQPGPAVWAVPHVQLHKDGVPAQSLVSAQLSASKAGGSYDYDTDNDSFTSMYGKDAEFINATNMMQVAKTMNKKFLQK